ncbi:MAG: ribosome assembly RNA-binding protein YhbY [SAR324 cluster bacterium]|nr:ribosome assembly RNA-binding protein YhbY [SAR324 cluster bacterium]
MLTSKQKRYLKGLAHSLKPLVNIGKQGLTEPLKKQTDTYLTQHELIKIKILEACQEDKKICAQTLSEQTTSQVVQIIGRTVVLYRPHPEEPVIILPST